MGHARRAWTRKRIRVVCPSDATFDTVPGSWISRFRRGRGTSAGNGPQGEDRFLVLGCQRSGTTLVGMMLEAHPLVRYFGEHERDLHLAGEHTRLLDLDAMRSITPEPRATFGFAANRDTHRWQELSVAFPALRFAWVERDVRQVVMSMMSLRWGSSSWASKFGPAELAKSEQLGEGTHLALLIEAVMASPPELRDTRVGALVWSVKREQREFAAHDVGDRLHLIEYGELVTQPRSTMEGVLSFLGLPWSANVLEHQDHVDPTARRIGGADPARSLDSHSLGKASQLSACQLDAIEELIGHHRERTLPSW